VVIATRLSGAGLDLGGTATTFRTASVRTDLFSGFRSALDGFTAQTGFDQQIVLQLLGTD
jgi:hypothetical protein